MCGKAPVIQPAPMKVGNITVTRREKLEAEVRLAEHYFNLARDEFRMADAAMAAAGRKLSDARTELKRLPEIKVLEYPGIRINGFGIVTPSQQFPKTHVRVWIGDTKTGSAENFLIDVIGHRIADGWKFPPDAK